MQQTRKIHSVNMFALQYRYITGKTESTDRGTLSRWAGWI